MTKKLVWRLGKLPFVSELQELVKDKIITQDEARGILFNSEEESKRDEESLKSEIKFLRDLVEKLSHSRTEIIKQIEIVQPIYRQYPWYTPYYTWCNAGTITSQTTGASVTSNAYASNANTATLMGQSVSNNFASINTF